MSNHPNNNQQSGKPADRNPGSKQDFKDKDANRNKQKYSADKDESDDSDSRE